MNEKIISSCCNANVRIYLNDNKEYATWCKNCGLSCQIVKVKKKPSGKYCKKEHCKYPFTPVKLNYCWSYAQLVDKDEQDSAEEKICKNCEYYEI